MTGGAATAEPGAGNEAGFTLVEVLVALALFSLLITLLFNNVRFGLQAWQHGSVHAEQFQSGMVSQDLLRRMIGNIYPLFIGDDPTRRHIDFEGGKDTLTFLGDAPIVANTGGRFRFRLAVERQHGRTDLVMNATPELARSEDSAMKTQTVLLSDIERAEFSYLGEAAAERTDQWHDSWTQRSDLPKLIRIRVAFASSDPRAWPELLIAPRITADVSCIYDPATTRCRGR